MQSSNGIDLKSVVDESTPHVETGNSMINELGFFHTSTNTQKAGIASGPPVGQLPKTALGDFMTRKTKIANGSLLTTDAIFSTITTLDPWSLYLSDTFIASKVSNFKYIRAGLRVFCSVIAPPGSYGLYVLAAIPNGVYQTGAIVEISPNVLNAFTVPHIIIDPATSTDGELLLPWIHWNDYADLRDTTTSEGYKEMWTLKLYCFQPLKTGMGDDIPTATYRIWTCCDNDYDMTIPYAQMDSFTEFRQKVNTTAEETTGMKPSGVAGAIATGAGAIGAAVPFLAPLAGPIAAVATGIGSVLSWFGFTRTADQQTPTTIVMRPYSNVANMDCDDTSEIAALSVSNSISYDPRISAPSAQDEASFNYLLQKWVLVGSTAWNLSDAAGDTLVNVPVTPFISYVGMGSGCRFTAGGMIGFPFQYWRSDMEYLLYIPFSKFHRGALQISWAPDIQLVAGDITNIRYNHVLDLGVGSIWTFKIGFANPEPVLESIPKLYGAAITSTAGCNGLFTITVANPLLAQQETANTRIFVFARCSPNATFGVPRNHFQVLADDGTTTVTKDFMTGFSLQAGALGDDIQEVKHFDLVPGVPYPVKEVCFGEMVDSVRALCQKFSQDLNITRNVASYLPRWLLMHFPSFPFTTQYLGMYGAAVEVNSQFFTFYGYYSCWFVGIAGSTRYKMLNTTSVAIPIGVSSVSTAKGINTQATNLSAHISTVSPIWCAPSGEGVEITVPYYGQKKYYPTFRTWNITSPLQGLNYGRVDAIDVPPYKQSAAAGTLTETLVGYVAAGPDIRFHMFRGFPSIITQTASTTGRWSVTAVP